LSLGIVALASARVERGQMDYAPDSGNNHSSPPNGCLLRTGFMFD